MNNYFRITAYHEKENISAIFDSNGKFEKLWQFSAFLVEKGFTIIEASKSENFLDGNIERVNENNEKIFLRAVQTTKPIYEIRISNNAPYNILKFDNKYYNIT